MEMLKPLVVQCQAEEGGSDSDFQSILKAQVPDSPAGLCMMTCLHEKAGIVSFNKVLFSNVSLSSRDVLISFKIKDGKMDKATFVEVGKGVVKNQADLIVHVAAIADECESSVTGKARCEMGAALGKCLKNGVIKRNVKIEFF